jgi:hypothetical protein
MNIGDSWAEIKESTVHSCWKRLYPDLLQYFRGFVEMHEDFIIEVKVEYPINIQEENKTKFSSLSKS